MSWELHKVGAVWAWYLYTAGKRIAVGAAGSRSIAELQLSNRLVSASR